MGKTLDELNNMLSDLNSNKRAVDLMEAFSRVIRFELEGEQSSFDVAIQRGQMAITKRISGEPDLIVTGDTNEFAKVIRGEQDVTHPIARGQLIVKKGKVSEMTLLNRILWIKKGG